VNLLEEVDFGGRDLTKLLNPVEAEEESWLIMYLSNVILKFILAPRV
jgi:hypothetical protein